MSEKENDIRCNMRGGCGSIPTALAKQKGKFDRCGRLIGMNSAAGRRKRGKNALP